MHELTSKLFASRDILVAVAHNDDIEFMFGGTLALLAEHQHKVGFSIVTVTFGSREKNTGESFSVTVDHQARAFETLGLKPRHSENHEFRARFLPDFEDDIRLALKGLKDRFDPGVVMTHYRDDRNQDHASVHEQVMRVFADRMVLGGEVSNTGDRLEPTLFVGLEARHVVAKHEALTAYEAEAHKSYFQYPLIEGLARVRGAHSARYEFAEAFELYRMHL